MKKFLFSLSCFFTLFLFTSNVYATSYNGYVDYSNLYSEDINKNYPIYARYSGNNVNYEDTTIALNQLCDYLNNNLTDYYYVVLLRPWSLTDGMQFSIILVQKQNVTGASFNFMGYNSSNNRKFIGFQGNFYYNGNSTRQIVSVGVLSYLTTFKDDISNLKLSNQTGSLGSLKLSDFTNSYLNNTASSSLAQSTSSYSFFNRSNTSNFNFGSTTMGSLDFDGGSYSVNGYISTVTPPVVDSNYVNSVINWGTFILYDSNIDVKLGSPDDSNSYNFEFTSTNSIDTIVLHDNFPKLKEILSDTSTIPSSNVQTFSDGSYGVNVNSIDNIVASTDNNFNNFDYNCPTDRDFVSGVCYIYSSDFVDFNSDFTNFYNQFIFTIGASGNPITLQSNKYYILTLRLYTSYNLQLDAMVFTLTGGVGNVGVNDIYKVVVNDYGFYKDFQIVFDMPSGINSNIYGFTIKFKNLSDLTSSIDNTYSFGVYKTFKLSQFDSLPTDTIISSNYSNNSIDSISNTNSSAFFSNFHLNDYGLSTIILMPLTYVRNLPNLVCTSIFLPVPKIGNIQLPCISSFMSSNFGVIWSLYKLIINGLICYKIIVNLFYTIKNIYKPDNDEIEVIEL